jgi:hypothetical protein
VATYSLGLSLVDFIPNLAFLVGAYFLVRASLLKRGQRCGRMLMAGTLLIFLGGMLKAVWKLVYTVGAGDLRLFSEIQFVLLAPGFLAMLVAVILMVRGKSRPHAQGEDGASGLRLVPAIAAWKLPFLVITTLSSLAALAALAFMAFRLHLIVAGVLFVLAALATFMMGGMASATQTVSMQWIVEGINSTGQIAFAAGAFLLYRHLRIQGSC